MSFYQQNVGSLVDAFPAIGTYNTDKTLVSDRVFYPHVSSPATDVKQNNCLVATADELQLHRVVARGLHVDQMGMMVNTLNAGSKFRFGVYTSDPITGLPKNLRFESGALDGGVVGAHMVSVDWQLLPGDWIAVVASNKTTLTFWGSTASAYWNNVVAYHDSTLLTFSIGTCLRGWSAPAAGAMPTDLTLPNAHLADPNRWVIVGIPAQTPFVFMHYDRIFP
jgi:hypothetical protein